MASRKQQQEQRTLAAQMQIAKRSYGAGYLRQFFDMVDHCRGPSGLTVREYYQFGLFRNELSRSDKKSFVGAARNAKQIEQLNGSRSQDYMSLFTDKLIFDTLVSAFGLASPELQACFGDSEIASARTLHSSDDIVEFLTGPAEYPIFCKPRFGSRGIGAMHIAGVSDDKSTLMLGDSTTVDLLATVDQIAKKYSDGYMFQSAVSQRDDLSKVFGKAPAVFRVTTIKAPKKSAEVLYIVIRVAKPDSMGVIASSEEQYNAEVDQRSGRLVSDFWSTDYFFSDGFRQQTDLNIKREEICISGIELMCDAARRMHDHFSAVSILGFDILMSDRGPVVLEGNYRPYTTIIQRLRDTGILSDRFDTRLGSLLRS